MKILIVTSKDHLYANYVLGLLKNTLDQHEIIIWEQDAIVPGKSKIAGFIRYLNVAGFYYVLMQIIKRMVFKKLNVYKRRLVNNIKTQKVYDEVKKIEPDLLLSLFSKEIIPNRLLQIPKKSLNVHPGLLPAYRGVSPIFWAMANGERTVGITLHELDSGIDTGKILGQMAYEIKSGDTEHSVYMALASLGAELLQLYFEKKHMSRVKRTKASYFSLPTKTAVHSFRKYGYRFF